MPSFIRANGSELTPLQHALEIFHQYLVDFYWYNQSGKRGSGKPIILDSSLFKGKQSGDTGRYHFIPQKYGDGIEGQNASIKGNEDSLDEFYMDIRIDQIAKAFKKKGKMTDKRTIWEFQAEAKKQLANWFKWRTENDIFDALTGYITDGVTRIDKDSIDSTALVSGAGRCFRPDYASNKFTTVDVAAADSTNTALLSAMTSTDIINTELLDELQYKAKTAGKYPMKPVRLEDGNEYYVLVIHPMCGVQLRQDSRWEKRAIAALTGNSALVKDPIATGAIGVWNRIIVKEANYVRTTEGASLTIARNLLLGADAAVMAYAQTLEYAEETDDYKREHGYAADEIRGIRKLTFDGCDLNVAQFPCAI